MKFSEKLKQLMEARNISNYRLAKEINVSQSTVANWKSGVAPLTVYAQKVADYFDVPLKEMLEETEETT